MAWFFFSNGFVSILADRDQTERLLVQARNENHLLAFVGDDPGQRALVITNPAADYLYPIFLSREFAVQRISELTEAIDYTNFKNSIQDSNYHDAAMEVWFSMNS
jgi:hypothetical protein